MDYIANPVLDVDALRLGKSCAPLQAAIHADARIGVEVTPVNEALGLHVPSWLQVKVDLDGQVKKHRVHFHQITIHVSFVHDVDEGVGLLEADVVTGVMLNVQTRWGHAVRCLIPLVIQMSCRPVEEDPGPISPKVIFAKYDVDCSGTLHHDEFCPAAVELAPVLPLGVVSSAFAALVGWTGSMSRAEFLQLFAEDDVEVRLRELSDEPPKALDLDRKPRLAELLSGLPIIATNLVAGRFLGKGAFGDVFAGHYRDHNVALKTMKSGQIQELKEEIHQNRMIKPHPNVVRFFGVGVLKQDTTPCLVLEFCKDGELLKWLQIRHDWPSRPGPLILLQILDQIAGAVAHLHAHETLHGDLAARNILLAGINDLGVPIPKLADFGLAERTYAAQSYQVNIMKKFPIAWAAPEVLVMRKFSKANDVWGFGVVMWECFSFGEVPWGNLESCADIIPEVTERGHRLKRPAGTPEQVYLIMRECWVEDRSHRPSINEVRSMLANETH
jgi:tRNA A-37 threonylcarbamoyl transferase component Bud32